MKPKEIKINFEQLKVLLCVSGGIAAYKSVELASGLVAAGTSIKTVMTNSACKLVGPKSFEAITKSQVYTDLWELGVPESIKHISLVEWADIIVVAPATANIIGKFANGISDDLLSTILCVCWSKPILLAPAMNVEMWNNPAVQRNVSALKKMGSEIVGPGKGRLACGIIAEGRMSEPDEIIEAIEKLLLKVDGKKETQ